MKPRNCSNINNYVASSLVNVVEEVRYSKITKIVAVIVIRPLLKTMLHRHSLIINNDQYCSSTLQSGKWIYMWQ
jgi:hypothetical protein